MSEKCKIPGCRSTARNSQLFIQRSGHICIHHFEAKYLKRSHDAEGSVTFVLKNDAVPTLLLEDDFKTETKPKRKRGSSGLANLQKARLKKSLRKERMKQLRRNSTKLQTGSDSSSEKTIPEKKTSIKAYEDLSTDYFLGDREVTPAEKLIIPLRLTTLINRLHDGSNLYKIPPASIKDLNVFPTFNIIKKIDELDGTNPLEWTTQQVFIFVKHISPVKGIAKLLRSEEVDGEALLNLTESDLVDHFHFDQNIIDSLIYSFSQLRKEIIKRYINI